MAERAVEAIATAQRLELRRQVLAAAAAADDKQAIDVVVLEVGGVLGICDWFVVCHGASDRQVRTIVEEVERAVAADGPRPLRVEGLEAREWVLLDYGDFVVHVFSEQARRYYDLERLWGDVPRLDWRAQAAGSRPAEPTDDRPDGDRAVGD